MWRTLFLVPCLILPTLGQLTQAAVDPVSYFPPAQPSDNNTYNLCRLWTFPPEYNQTALRPDASGHRLRVANALNTLKTRYKECCRTNLTLPCALDSWSEVMANFCLEPEKANGTSSPCCLKLGAQRDACFKERAPFQNYDGEIYKVNLTKLQEPTMEILCRMRLKVLTEGPEKPLVMRFQRYCCKFETMDEKIECGIDEKAIFSKILCNQNGTKWTDNLSCCSKDPESCFDTGDLAQVVVYVKN